VNNVEGGITTLTGPNQRCRVETSACLRNSGVVRAFITS